MQKPTFVDTVTQIPADFLNLVADVIFGPLNQATTVIGVQQALGIGGMAAQNPNAVVITGGTLDAVQIGYSAQSQGKFSTLYSYQVPTDPNHAANKSYVDSQIALAGMNPGYLQNNYLNLAGGTLTGPLTLSANPTAPLHAATKAYVDSTAQGYVTQASLNQSLSNVASQSYVNTLFAQQVARQLYHDSYTMSGTTNVIGLRAQPSGDVMVWVNSVPVPKNQITVGTLNVTLQTNPVGAVEVMYFSATGTGSQFSGVLLLSGGVMTGPLTLSNDPINPLDAATKEYVDSHSGGGGGGGGPIPTTQIINGVGVSQQLVINPFSGPAQFALTLTQASCAISFAAQAIPNTYPSNAIWSFSVLLKQGTGSNTVTWPSNINWSNGAPPTLSYRVGYVDLITFTTDPFASTPTWIGTLEGSWYTM